MAGEFDLERFVDAQAAIYDQVYRELEAGRKSSHWMWFIFPQIAGLGYSAMARRYAINCREEAVAYAAHPILGERLRRCTRLVNAVDARTVHQIFGTPDDMKFRSSMTLFAACVGAEAIFQAALDKYFAGEPDQLTLDRL